MSATFDYFGESFEYAPEFPAFEWAEFHAARLEGDALAEADAQGYLVRLAVACVAEKDQARFRKVSRQNHAKLPDWSKVIGDFTTEEAERPTGQPTDSSDGLSATESSSVSQPAASATSEETVRPIRPDLALALSRSA